MGVGEDNDPDPDPDPVAGFLSWCRRVGLDLSPKVSESWAGRRGRRAGQL